MATVPTLPSSGTTSAIFTGFTLIPNIAKQLTTSLMTTSPFSSNKGIDNMNSGQGFVFFIILILLIYLTMMLGAFVFNTSVVKIMPSLKKVTTLDFFGLYIVIHLLFC